MTGSHVPDAAAVPEAGTSAVPDGRGATAFPGGTSVTRLSVYADACADGVHGGTPHVHTASTEAYVVVSGRGGLQTVDPTGYRETRLEAGSTVWFTPGTVHRVINHDALEVVVVMQNAGLPEAGDAVMTFPPAIVGDPRRYRAAATLPAGVPDEETEAAVRRRRDLAVDGFLAIADHAQRGDFGPLERFYADAVALVRPAVSRWRAIWQDTVEPATRTTGDVLDALERGDGSHLSRAALLESPPVQRWGMCGRLRTHDVRDPVVRSAGPDHTRR